MVCRLQKRKYIPRYTPFPKPTQSKANVPPTYGLSRLFHLNTCLRKTKRTQKSAGRKQRSVFFFFKSRHVKKLPKCTDVESNSVHRREAATVREHRRLFPRCLISHTPRTGGSIRRKHCQHTLTEYAKGQTQRGSGVRQGHRKIVCVGKQPPHKNPIF